MLLISYIFFYLVDKPLYNLYNKQRRNRRECLQWCNECGVISSRV